MNQFSKHLLVALGALLISSACIAQTNSKDKAAKKEPEQNSMLRLMCDGNDVGAEITINGKFKGECPVDVSVPEGRLQVHATKKDGETQERVFDQEVNMGDGVVKRLEIHLVTPPQDDMSVLKALGPLPTIEGIQKYLAKYPRSKYVNELKNLLSDLEHVRSFMSNLPIDLAIKTVRGNGKRIVATFEDPNCAYCKKLNKEFEKMDNVTVYVFLYPILGSDSTEKANNIWCASDPATAWREWMLEGKLPEQRTCNTEAMSKIKTIGSTTLAVRGTPAIFLQNGRRLGGFYPASGLVEAMGEKGL